MHVDEHTIDLDAMVDVYYRSAPAPGTAPLYIHGVPTSSEDWVPFLARSGGIAPDLIGFGRSGKAGNLDYSLGGLAAFVEQFLTRIGVDRVKLVGHDWGASVALVFAQRHPHRVERLVICDAVPLLDGFRWPWFARLWRRRAVGELTMGSITRWLMARVLRSGNVDPNSWTQTRLDSVWKSFDQGTQRAILRLYRSTDAYQLAAAGAGLSALEMPTMVVWGERDPWLDVEFAEAFAAKLPRVRLERVADAGHWPWLDRPEVVETIGAFLEEPTQLRR